VRLAAPAGKSDGQALPGCGHAERALQASWWQEHGAAHVRVSRRSASTEGVLPANITSDLRSTNSFAIARIRSRSPEGQR
jgi:hypothetical protein